MSFPSCLPNLTPAKWIWYPSGRTLPNTFVLFRHALELRSKPLRATGWIAADSRYRLEVNGQRIQWGPAPADPRWPEADPLDLTQALQAGQNVIGATVLYYGHGDGTWPVGRPGFLFWMEIEDAGGTRDVVVSSPSWRTHLSRAWTPGHYKRWYLRALQEEFDARLHPHGWSAADFVLTDDWLPAMPLAGSPNKPALANGYPDYLLDLGPGPADTELRPRSIPLLRETWVPASRLAEMHAIDWIRPPEEYFAVRTPGAFRAEALPVASESAPGQWEIDRDGTALTFEFQEQIVGWPGFAIDAPAGTTVELLVHEAHEPGGPALLNTHFDAWTRFICREGRNRFETFDFESLRWLQLHVHHCTGKVVISEVGVRRREFPWPHQARIRTSEPALQRLFDASVNTLRNCAQETLVDGMGRERQQYSGDCGHQLHAIHLAFGESRLVARYLTTFSQGLTQDGYFLDCWPGYDRLARLMEGQLHLTMWGPILDHGIGFNFDCWHHYLHAGELDALREPYPRLLRFAEYLRTIVDRDGLLAVENIGIPSVWIDHDAYLRQRHKQCAFNLYAAAMLQHALAPICRAFGADGQAEAALQLGGKLQAAAVKKFWCRERSLFVNNLPWLAEEKEIRTCDRSLATAILFDQCPDGQIDAALRSLADCPGSMGFSYPANAGWRLWALAKCGRIDVVLHDLRTRWAGMDSVKLNNTLQEPWQARSDSREQWSHCAVVPLYIACHALAGLRPLEPGFARFELRPQPGDLEQIEVIAHTVRGPIRFRADGRELRIETPATAVGEIILPAGRSFALEPATGPVPAAHRRYRLPQGRECTLSL